MSAALIHRWIGTGLVVAFVVLVVWGAALRLARRDEAPVPYLALQHWTENILILQTVIGVVFLFMGRRVVGDELVWLHYLYGSLFPLIAIIGGRIAGLRREHYTYVGMAWGAFFAFGLVLRALQTGLFASCGADVFNLECVF